MDVPGVLEVVPIQDLFCCGISMIEDIGNGLLRLWCYTQQTSPGRDAEAPELIVVAKIIIPAAAMPAMIARAMKALGRTMSKDAAEQLTSLH